MPLRCTDADFLAQPTVIPSQVVTTRRRCVSKLTRSFKKAATTGKGLTFSIEKNDRPKDRKTRARHVQNRPIKIISAWQINGKRTQTKQQRRNHRTAYIILDSAKSTSPQPPLALQASAVSVSLRPVAWPRPTPPWGLVFLLDRAINSCGRAVINSFVQYNSSSRR